MKKVREGRKSDREDGRERPMADDGELSLEKKGKKVFECN